MANAPRRLTEEEVKYVLSIKEEQVVKDLMVELFAYGKSRKPKFNTNDRFRMPAGTMGSKEAMDTTVGRYIFNLFIISPHFQDVVGYINDPITSGKLNEIEDQLSELIMDKKVPPEHFIDYLNRIQWIGYALNDFLSPSMSEAVIIPNKKVAARKKELMKKHKEAISSGDPIVATQIEEDLIKLAKSELKGDPSMDLYDSGAKHKFGNHYKSLDIMKGAIRDNSTGQYNVSMTNYMDGIEKNEYHNYGDTIVYAAHSRAIGTQKGGLKFQPTLNALNCWEPLVSA
jgi:hypothetical protein